MIKKIFALCICVALSVCALTGCGFNMGGGNYDLYIFNGKGESAAALEAAAEKFTEETGKKVKTFSLGGGTISSSE